MIHLVLLSLSALSMLCLPLALGVVISRRLGMGWRLFAVGIATFIGSQIAHIPLNAGVAVLFTQGIVPAPPAALTAWLLPIGLGLSAGLCEETARLVGYRLLAEHRRTWSHAMMVGAGHGGIESMIVGVMAVFGVINLALLTGADLASYGVTEDQIPIVQAQLTAFWETPAYLVPAGGVERLFAVCCHLAFSVLVARAILRGEARWWIAAVLGHAALDAGAVAIAPHGIVPAEVFVGGCALLAVATVLWLREAPADSPARSLDPIEPMAVTRVSMEDSARILDDS